MRKHGKQKNALLRFHCNTCYANVPQCYVTHTLSIQH